MSTEMTNDELRRRLVQGMALCPNEHEAHSEPMIDAARYWLTCGDKIVASTVLNDSDPTGPEPYFERWNRQHNLEVTRDHLKRVLDPPPDEPRKIKPGGLLEDLLIIGQTTSDTLKRLKSIVEMQADRIAALETAVEEQGKRLVTAEQRLQGNLAL